MKSYIFANARTAFWYGLKKLPFEKGQVLLVPDYICDVITHPLEDLGVRYVFYPIDDSFLPCWDVIESLQKKHSAQGLLLVHYFGQPQDLDRAKEFCHRHSIFLIEDNSHGHGGTLDGQPLGCFGDLGISSPRKLLQTENGGILYLRGNQVEPKEDEILNNPSNIINQLMLRRLRSITQLKSIYRKLFQEVPDFSDYSAFPEARLAYQTADRNSAKLISKEDWSIHSANRREAWESWSNFASANGMQPIWMKPHPNSSPWLLPVYANNSSEREQWLRNGWLAGKDYSPWPSLPKMVISSSKSSILRWQRLLCFPLNNKYV